MPREPPAGGQASFVEMIQPPARRADPESPGGVLAKELSTNGFRVVDVWIIDGVVNGVGGTTSIIGRFVYGGLDQRVVDGVFNGLSAVADTAGQSLRRLQTGRVQQYATGFVTGAVVLVIAVVIFR